MIYNSMMKCSPEPLGRTWIPQTNLISRLNPWNPYWTVVYYIKKQFALKLLGIKVLECKMPNSTKLTRIVIRDGPGTQIFATLYFLCCKVHRVRQVSERDHSCTG